ncbi:MAG: methyl-accepting chemotaxis protein [SAR324 cluster bacterium]|nr:methyl-accepting chemotaxis protein [SAR324 cluster bacterium]
MSVGISFQTQNKLTQSAEQLEIRYQQLREMDNLRYVLTNITLLFMDIIIDKDEGKISDERLAELDKFEKLINNNQKTLLAAADTELERKNLQLVIGNILKEIEMGKNILIPAVINRTMTETLTMQLDDDIDGLGDEAEKAIGITIKSIQAEVVEAKLEAEETKATAEKKLIFTLVLGSLLGILSALVLTSQIINTLGGEPSDMAKLAEEIASGDLKPRNAKNPKGLFANMLEMSAKINVIMTQLLGQSKVLSSASSELSAVSSQMSSSSEEVSVQAGVIAAAAEEIGANLDSVASAIVQVSANVSTVASNTEVMTSNIDSVSSAATEMPANLESIQSSVEKITKDSTNVAHMASDAFKIANEAGVLSSSVNNAMQTLSTSAVEIGDVTGMIKVIAEQTNLLALNANIEAASAGDAGKGFAVVANEIKELAKQSAGAAENISGKIAGTQEHTKKAVESITKMTGIIDQVGDSSQKIDAITQEQAISAKNILGNVKESVVAVGEVAQLVSEMSGAASQVAMNINELDTAIGGVAKNAEELKTASSEVFGNISEIALATKETANGSALVNTKATEFDALSQSLNEITNRFTLN